MKGFIKKTTVIYLAIATFIFMSGLFLYPFKASAVVTTKFMEPGGDATFNVALKTAGGFYQFIGNTPTIVTDFVHGTHQKSIQFNSIDQAVTPDSVFSDSGGRISLYIYISALPTGTIGFYEIDTTGGAREVVYLKLTSGGVLQMTDELGTQIGTNGSTLSTGKWYRISLAYTITSTTINRFELFVDGVSDISITNATLTRTGSSVFALGQAVSVDATFNWRASDVYIDDSSSLTDTGNIWVTAKRPNANGTTNNFTTNGTGSGYGTGNSVDVNERPLSTASWVQAVVSGSAKTDEYNIESKSTGDIIINSYDTIIDTIGWLYASSTASETASMVLNGATSNVALTTSNTMFTQAAGSSAYPAGTGTDIGLTTTTASATVGLAETGVMVAFIPGTPPNVSTVQINSQVNVTGQILIK